MAAHLRKVGDDSIPSVCSTNASIQDVSFLFPLPFIALGVITKTLLVVLRVAAEVPASLAAIRYYELTSVRQFNWMPEVFLNRLYYLILLLFAVLYYDRVMHFHQDLAVR